MFRFDPYSPANDADPFDAYKTLRDEYPAFWCEEAGMWVYSRYDDIIAALNDWQTYSSAKGNLVDELPNRAGATLGTTDPPRHDRLRALIQKAMTKRALDVIVEPTRGMCKKHLDALDGRKSFDFVAEYSSKVTVDLLFDLFAMPESGRQTVRDNAVLMVQTDPVTRQKGPEHIGAYEWMAKYANELIAERKKAPGEDLLSNFITAEIDGESLADREIQMTVTTLIMAGVESLSGFLSMMAYNLAEQHDARRALVADPSLIPDAIEESLRFNTSAQRFRRCLTRDVENHGQIMKEGDFIMLVYGSGNRDERRFANPDVFDIARKPRGHLGFGGGVHACLGGALARVATKIAFEEFLGRYPEFERVGETTKWVPSSNFRSPMKLDLAAA
ncbi:cytochrome P450 [Rhodobium orientis]|uniref:Cytochrome n=1 Tax=Rhodobium orientis TaxID=34017 RepID=A0A327JSF2_9HYPH|nr:cytochrome P450 [Rhodobium orientis]MBB4302549.1 cytochrome P450 [Rhodobium orientis]MBK5949398.1 cytochrome [Rhodobium orientis]RAI29167.1 cytochrome [Rhodobium orientis]